eukprot:TRINITY_DN15499_c0_g1_i1.p1 TRINITY_DN15499_c0_g1~~TRINITY_DN15499_c0_g1_i1.p1  ORF type:complete len:353 (-),score=37.27 TRINITY_DN15499_c0_g1_i1:211-1269(-)
MWRIALLRSVVSFFLSMGALVFAISIIFPAMLSSQGVNVSVDRVDRAKCTCDCWDGYFKGSYSRGSYKSVFFNMDAGTIALLLVILFYGSIAQKAILRVAEAMFCRPKTSLYLPVLFHVIWYPNFYCFWMYFNYINDRWFDMFQPQLYYSLTELIMAACCYWMLDPCLPSSDTTPLSCTSAFPSASTLASITTFSSTSPATSNKPPSPKFHHNSQQENIVFNTVFVEGVSENNGQESTSAKVERTDSLVIHWILSWLVAFFAFSHVIRGSLDQFVKNVIFGQGSIGQASRDIAFMVGDLTLLLWSSCYIWQLAKQRFLPHTRSLAIRKNAITFLLCLVFEQALLFFVPNMGS